jgi:hypothetical protein
MKMTIVNMASVDRTAFRNAIRAIATQVTSDFQPEWGVGATIHNITLTKLPTKARIEGRHDAILYVGDSSEDPNTGIDGALGYHSANHRDVPYGFVYMDVVREYDEEWTTTLSHEVLELLADPSAALTVTGPDPKRHTHMVHRDLEVCDPVQGDSYEITGIKVSNFVNRAYFGLVGGSPSTNFLELELAAFGVRPGGYFQYEDGNQVLQVQGARALEMKAKRDVARLKMGKGRRNARRAARFQP